MEKTTSELQRENRMLRKALTEAQTEASALLRRINMVLEAMHAPAGDEIDEIPAPEDSLWLSEYDPEPDEFYDPDYYDYISGDRYFDEMRYEYESEEDLARGEGFYLDDDGNWIPMDDDDLD